MHLEDLARTSAAVGDSPARLAKTRTLASFLAALAPEEVPVAVAYLSGELPGGSIGVGWASLRAVPEPSPAPATLALLDVHALLGTVAKATGPGSQAVRRKALGDLFGRATELEQRFLRKLLLGDLRQGALEGVMVEAIAGAAGVRARDVRRAVMLNGDLGEVGAAALARGAEGLADIRLTPLRPLQPMLAQTAPDVASALRRIGEASIEWKLDGARIQVHRVGDEVRAFTRNLADITSRVPELVEAIGSLPLESVILDGEAIALGTAGRPQPFQVTMSRFGSRLDVDQLRRAVPLSFFFFDCLHLDGDDLIDRPAMERFDALSERLPPGMRTPGTRRPDAAEAGRFLDEALQRGHEGVMVKALDAPYEAGRRGAAWIKVKRAHTLDLAVLAAEWGHGRRRGWLSNLHLGARDAEHGGFVMLGKTFKGMTDRMLAWQTERLLSLETGRDGIVVHVRPELVVEVAFDGIQTSSRYPGGLALRFARIKGYRSDKTAAEADTIDAVRALRAGGVAGPRA